MKKKEYKKPTANVVRMNSRASLLAGSAQGARIYGEAEDDWEGL